MFHIGFVSYMKQTVIGSINKWLLVLNENLAPTVHQFKLSAPSAFNPQSLLVLNQNNSPTPHGDAAENNSLGFIKKKE